MTTQTNNITIGYKYTDYTFNSTGWNSICEVISEPKEDKYAQISRVKVKMTFEGKDIPAKISWVALHTINNYKTLN